MWREIRKVNIYSLQKIKKQGREGGLDLGKEMLGLADSSESKRPDSGVKGKVKWQGDEKSLVEKVQEGADKFSY